MSAKKEDIVMQFEALQSLLQHPGWHLLQEQLRRDAAFAMSQMRAAKTQEDLLRNTYNYLAVTHLSTAPDMMMQPLHQQLQLLNKLERKP